MEGLQRWPLPEWPQEEAQRWPLPERERRRQQVEAAGEKVVGAEGQEGVRPASICRGS